MSRDAVLERIRSALGRSESQPPPAPPAPLLASQEQTADQRLQRFLTALHALNAATCVANSHDEAAAYIAQCTAGRSVICSRSPVVAECGVTSTTTDPAAADAGITGVSYALAATGTLVILAGEAENRLISLLPPLHVAVVRESQLLGSIDDLFAIVCKPADSTSAMILITGPSRTGDIEQILVCGVHGPGELHVIVLRN